LLGGSRCPKPIGILLVIFIQKLKSAGFIIVAVDNFISYPTAGAAAAWIPLSVADVLSVFLLLVYDFTNIQLEFLFS